MSGILVGGASAAQSVAVLPVAPAAAAAWGGKGTASGGCAFVGYASAVIVVSIVVPLPRFETVIIFSSGGAAG